MGALKRQEAVGLGGLLAKRGSRTVYTPAEQLRLIARCVAELQASATALLVGDVLPRLRRAGVSLLSYEELAPEELVALRGYFVEKVEPLLTPLAVDPGHPFPCECDLCCCRIAAVCHRCGVSLAHAVSCFAPFFFPVPFPAQPSRGCRSP